MKRLLALLLVLVTMSVFITPVMAEGDKIDPSEVWVTTGWFTSAVACNFDGGADTIVSLRLKPEDVRYHLTIEVRGLGLKDILVPEEYVQWDGEEPWFCEQFLNMVLEHLHEGLQDYPTDPA